MDFLFRKYFWVINGALLIVVAFLVARLVISYVEYGVLFVPWSGAVDAAGAGDSSEISFRGESFGRRVNKSLREEIVKNSGKPDDETVPVEALEVAKEEEPTEEPLEVEPAGAIEIEFLAAIVTEDPMTNMAFVKIDNGDGRWVTVGTDLLNGVLAAEITRTMFRASDGTIRYLWEKVEPKEGAGSKTKLASLTSGPGANRITDRPERPAVESTRPPAAGKGMEGVTKVNEFEYHIDRGLLDEKLQDLGALGREARVIPNYDRESGSYKGFKLIGVRPNSLYRNIGIRSGDVILQVNGEEMNSPSKALELFTKLQTSNEISLDIKRRGKVETLQYKIQ
ncbi:MAG: type II secretion system protein GspC [Pseudomonadota bacterium]